MKNLKHFLSYLTILFIVLLGMEVALRIYALFPQDSTYFVVDNDIGYRSRPNKPIGNHLTTNDGGFNDINHSAKPGKGASRLALVGDSFVYGAVTRDKNISFVLADLARQNDTDLDVINMGIAAAGPKNYLGLMKHDVAQSNSDMVAVVIFVGNDITQSHPHFKTSVWLNSTRETLIRPYYIGFSREYSYLYRSLRSVFRTMREQPGKTPGDSFSRETFMGVEQQRSLIYEKEMSTFIRDSFEGVIDLIEQMSLEAKRQNKPLFVVLAPDELQISAPIQEYLKSHYLLDPPEYDFGQPQSILTEALSNRGIPVLDLLPIFLNSRREEELYLQYNTHWNDNGNRLAAEAIWQYIRENSLL